MEKKYYTDNFEQLLKDSTDNFRMYPSKRVWHSIYNDLHPSRKWPSLAVLLFIVSSVIFIGLSNKKQVASAVIDASSTGTSKLTASVKKVSNNISPTTNSNGTDELGYVQSQGQQKNFSNTISVPGNNKTVLYNHSKTNQQSAGFTSLNKQALNSRNSASLNVAHIVDTDNPETSSSIVTDAIAGSQQPVSLPTGTNSLIKNENEQADLNFVTKKITAETEKKLSTVDKNNNNKEWIEDYAFHNKPSSSKWKTRVTYQLYLTPSVGYRFLSKGTDFNPVSAALVAPASGSNVQDYKEALSQTAAVNMEIGGNILYNISKRWDLKAGIQLNYTNYAINAYELKHPTLTTLLLNDISNGFPVLTSRSTTLANISGVSTKKLNNSTYQISIPLGANLKLAGKNNLKWFAGATIQPTYIAGGKSYLISSDLKNYVADNSYTRMWNLNAGIETFISYKTNGGITINAGPQFRYQVLSTYSKQYTYTEKLYNLGLKIGIITRF